jgi:hypothetical protein
MKKDLISLGLALTVCNVKLSGGSVKNRPLKKKDIFFSTSNVVFLKAF